MYEFKHTVNRGFPRKSYAFKQLADLAIVHFDECPKLVTIGVHANHSEITPLHCYRERDRRIIDFSVLKQNIHIRASKEGIRFCLVHVLSKLNLPYWLLACESDRRGFLLPSHIFNEYGNLLSLKRGAPGKIIH